MEGEEREQTFAGARAFAEAGDWERVRLILANWDLLDLVDFLEEERDLDPVALLRALPEGRAADVLAQLDPGHQERILDALPDAEARTLLEGLSPDQRTAVLAPMPAASARRLLTLLSPEDQKEARGLLAHPPESVGRLMTPDYVAIRPEWTLAQVLAYVRRHGHDSETISRVYVVDADGVLLDDLRLRQVILGDPETRVADLMNRDYPSLRPADDREVAVREMQRKGVYALPVVGDDGKLLGIVTADDVLAVAQKEATEDIQKMGAMEALGTPYLETPFWTMVRKRGGWLALLFLGEMLTASAMGVFQDEIAKYVVLALFIPLIISSGGNSGSQATTLVIRSLSLGELRTRDWWRVARRELASGIALGVLLATIGILRIFVWQQLFGTYGAGVAQLALAIGLSLIGVVTWGTLMGASLPFILRRAGFDPASASAPLVATLVDVSGLVIYFSIAKVILIGAGG
jgi:magnesium transporter